MKDEAEGVAVGRGRGEKTGRRVESRIDEESQCMRKDLEVKEKESGLRK